MDQNQSRNYKKYNSKNPLMGVVISNFMKNLKETAVPLKNINNVIDIGCGEGFVINCLNYPKITGVDISRNALRIAKEKNPECEFCSGSICDISFKENSFDLVIATEVLEHLDKPDLALQEIRRITKNYCIISVPNEPYFRAMNFLRGKNLTRFGNDPEHVQNWSSGKFVSLIILMFWKFEGRFPGLWFYAKNNY